MKKFFSGVLAVLTLFLFTTPAFAHVIVYPHQVGEAATQDFTVSVPNERDNPVISVRLLIPKGLTDVTPNATPGWTITLKEKGNEIDWTHGSIPVGQRAEFIFQAQVPASPTTLAWKAYQTYSDGTVVSWDVDPAKLNNLSDAQQDQLADKENKGEYSTTQITNDLATNSTNSSQTFDSTEILAGFALLLSVAALAVSLKKK